MPPRFSSVAKTHVGLVRSHNEDSFFADDAHGLYIVADGLGGHAAGEVASRIVTDSIPKYLLEHRDSKDSDILKKAILYADEMIHQDIEKDERLKTMGSTVVALYCEYSKIHIAHVGDSRAYCFSNGTLERLTKDHTWVEEQITKGLLSEAEAFVHPMRNIITQGLGNNSKIIISQRVLMPKEDSIYLLCSDGLTGMLEDQAIESIFKESQSDQESLERMHAVAMELGGSDNITAIIIR